LLNKNLSAEGSNAEPGQEDSTVPTPTIALNSDSGAAGDHITNDNQVKVTLAADVASWEYSLDNSAHWAAGVGHQLQPARRHDLCGGRRAGAADRRGGQSAGAAGIARRAAVVEGY
jgi:hypothetical protein